MNTSNHPDASWLVSYSAAGLTSSYNMVLKAHLAVCAQCRSTLKQADILGAEFMFGENTEAMDSNPEPMPELGVKADDAIEWSKEQSTDLEGFFNQYVGKHLDCFHWMTAGKGLKVCKLAASDNDRMWMLRAQPGTVLPKHSHSGSELTLVLKGAYLSQDTIYRVGDIEDADDSNVHQPVVSSDEECICVAAVDGPLRFSGILPRIAQPFIGI